MQSKRLVIDANILIRAVLGWRVRELIAQANEDVAFYIAEANFEEASHYLAELAPRRGIDDAVWRSSLSTAMMSIQFVGQEELVLVEADACARIARRDERDWPALAAALLLDCPIWTEDQDFFGTGVSTWTTATVEIYLRAP
jgi:predicted nucleic acid-binding protein